MHLRRERIALDRPGQVQARVVEAIGGCEEHSVGGVADGVVRIERQRRQERLLGGAPVRFEMERVDALGAVRFGQLRVEGQGPGHRLERLGLRLRGRHPAVDPQDRIAVGEPGVGRGEGVVEGDGALEAGDRRADDRRRPLVPEMTPLQVEVIGVRVDGRATHRLPFPADERRRDGGDDGPDDFVLHRRRRRPVRGRSARTRCGTRRPHP